MLSPKYKIAAILVTWGVIVLGLMSLYPQWHLYKNVPKYYTWQNVEQKIKENSHAEDVVVFEPDWLVGYATDGRRFKDLSIVSLKSVMAGAYERSANVWIISAFKRSKNTRKLVERGWSVESKTPVDELFLYQLGSTEGHKDYDFASHLAEADAIVEGKSGGKSKANLKDGQLIFDPKSKWKNVRIVHRKFVDETQRCIWFHPEEGKTKKLSYLEVPLKAKLDYYAGILKSGQKTPPGSPVQFNIYINKQKVVERLVNDTDTKLNKSVALDTFSAKTGEVIFEVTTESDKQRHFCFNAWLRDG